MKHIKQLISANIFGKGKPYKIRENPSAQHFVECKTEKQNKQINFNKWIQTSMLPKYLPPSNRLNFPFRLCCQYGQNVYIYILLFQEWTIFLYTARLNWAQILNVTLNFTVLHIYNWLECRIFTCKTKCA